MKYKAVYLLAGVGSRLRPYTDDRPKSLIEVNGKAFLSRSVDTMKSRGITDFVVVTGYMDDKIKSFFATHYPDLNIEFIHNEIYNSTNNSYSLYLAKEAFKNNEAMYLLDGDILFQPEIIDLLQKTADSKNVLATRKADDLADEEMKVILKNDTDIISIEKKLDPKRSYGESIGIAKFSPDFTQKLFSTLERRMVSLGIVNEFYEASFQELLDKGETLSIVDTQSYKCMEVDTVEDLEEAKRSIIQHIDEVNSCQS